MRAIAQADLIVTTPEKWDGVSRSWQNRSYVQKVSILIIDEIHLLGEHVLLFLIRVVAKCEEVCWYLRQKYTCWRLNLFFFSVFQWTFCLLGDERGPVLEVIVSRTNFISSHTEKPVRVVGLSTALANARDLADWLNINQVQKMFQRMIVHFCCIKTN